MLKELKYEYDLNQIGGSDDYYVITSNKNELTKDQIINLLIEVFKYQPNATAILNSASFENDIFIGYCQITTLEPKKLLSQLCWEYPCSDQKNRSEITIDVE